MSRPTNHRLQIREISQTQQTLLQKSQANSPQDRGIERQVVKAFEFAEERFERMRSTGKMEIGSLRHL